jgi:hypothetical protein
MVSNSLKNAAISSSSFGLEGCLWKGITSPIGLPLGASPLCPSHLNVSPTRRTRKTGFLDASNSSICHSLFCLRLREILPTRSPQTLVNSCQAASWLDSSVPQSAAPENVRFGCGRNRAAWRKPMLLPKALMKNNSKSASVADSLLSAYNH